MAIDDPVLDNLSDRQSSAPGAAVLACGRHRDFEALDQLFDPDGEVHGALGVLPVGQYLGQMRSRPRTFAASMHFLGDPLIELAIGTDIGRLDTYGVVFQRRGERTQRATMSSWASATSTTW